MGNAPRRTTDWKPGSSLRRFPPESNERRNHDWLRSNDRFHKLVPPFHRYGSTPNRSRRICNRSRPFAPYLHGNCWPFRGRDRNEKRRENGGKKVRNTEPKEAPDACRRRRSSPNRLPVGLRGSACNRATRRDAEILAN